LLYIRESEVTVMFEDIKCPLLSAASATKAVAEIAENEAQICLSTTP
jgi:hypothetical protein